MSEKQYGLSLKEQAHFLGVVCHVMENPEICPITVMRDLDSPCPFGLDVTCKKVEQDMWYDFLKNREMPNG